MDTVTAPARSLVLSLAQAGLFAGRPVAGSLSPLPEAAITAAPEDRTLLQREGLLDQAGGPTAAWLPVVTTLSNPNLRLVGQTGGPSGINHLQAFGSPASQDHLVAFTARGERECTLAWPIEVDHVLALLTEAVGLDAPGVDPGIRLELSDQAFILLAAALDARRELELESMLARERFAEPIISNAALTVGLKTGLQSDDQRWLLPIFRRVLPSLPSFEQIDVARVLDELVGAAILEKDRTTGEHAFLPGFEPVRLRLQAPLGWAAFAATGLAGGKPRSAGLSALRTLGGLWGIEAAEGRVRFVTTEPARLLKGWQATIDAVRPPPEVTAAKPSARFCGSCGAALKPDWKYCGKCGAAIA